jgi:hypothetical protein
MSKQASLTADIFYNDRRKCSFPITSLTKFKRRSQMSGTTQPPTSTAKDLLVQKLSSKTGLAPQHVETIVDGTVSEMVSPTALGASIRRAMGNGCNNGCGGESAS